MSDQDDLACIHPSVTPRSSLGSGAISYSSGSSISPSTSSSGSHGSAKSAVSECLGAWLNYLQILNNLCASGLRLAQSTNVLEQWGLYEQTSGLPQHIAGIQLPQHTPGGAPGAQFITAWDDLARATAVATSTVKSHIVSVLQDFVTQPMSAVAVDQEADIQRAQRDHNQQIIMETAQTMINVQHQFCVASYDSFSPLMCCFVCQAPVGFAHDPECAMIQQYPRSGGNGGSGGCGNVGGQTGIGDPRSQTPSPHFGPMNFGASNKNERVDGNIGGGGGGVSGYRMPTGNVPVDPRSIIYGSGGDCQIMGPAGMNTGSGGISTIENRGPSPHHEIRGPSPIQGFLENIRGPLPNPGHLLGMKTPFYRGPRSPLNFPLFPLNGQRRWSEAAAGEVKGESFMDAESNMRRWSMPWEASKCVKNTVTWHQTRIMPVSKLAVPASKSNSDRSQSTTPDSMWPSSATSQDGLAEAIQLLSCRPSRIYTQQQPTMPPLGPPFIEEPQTSNIATYEMWSDRTQERLPSIKFPRPRDDEHHHQS